MTATAAPPGPAGPVSLLDAGRSAAGGDRFDVAARVFVVALFLLLSVRIAQDFLQTARVTGLLLLTSEVLVVVLMLVRRPATRVDRSASARLVTVITTVCPLFLRPSSAGGIVADPLTAGLSSLGVLVTVAGQLSLGRSFGLVPANRGIVCSGMYRFVRHPIYAGYILAHIGFLMAHPTLRNAALAVSGDVALAVRAIFEERTLRRDDRYAQYERRVRRRLIPGVF